MSYRRVPHDQSPVLGGRGQPVAVGREGERAVDAAPALQLVAATSEYSR
jgi:hypothetical protein